MNLRTLLFIQAIAISFLLVSLYILVLRIEAIEERKFNENFDNNKYYDLDDDNEESDTGIIKNQYIVVLRDNATFIDEYTRTNWIKRALDDSNESYSKIIHYYSLPRPVGWNTPSESVKILKKNNIENDESFKGFAAKLSPDMYEYFARHPSVKFIERDAYVKLDDIVENENSEEKVVSEIKKPYENHNDNDMSESSIIYKVKSSVNLSRLVNRKPTSSDNAYYKFSYESAYDVYTYVIDTGVNADHSEFIDRLGYDTVNKKRITIGKNYVTNESNTDLNGHGTHVAGIIGSTTWGVAKRVNIVSVKVMNQSGSGKWSDIIAAMEWCQNHLLTQTKSKKGVLNISISGKVMESVNNAVKAIVSQGIYISAASGNNGMEACQYSPASSSAYGAVVVGSIDSDDSLSSFSNYGKCVSIFAPGSKIKSTSNASNTGSKYMSGTSMATPHVTGVMALILSAKNLSPKELYKTLQNEASSGYIKDIDSGSPNLIAYIPNYALVSRCNPLEPYDCISSTELGNSKDIDDEDNISKINSTQNLNDLVVLQNK